MSAGKAQATVQREAAGSQVAVDPEVAVLHERLRVLEKEAGWLRRSGEQLARQLFERARRDHATAAQALAISESRRQAAEKRLGAARRRAEQAEARAAAAERRLKQVKASTTWRAGRVVMAGPRAVRRRLRNG